MNVSCNADPEYIPEGGGGMSGEVVSTRIKVVIADSELQDRLNPESPAYFGEEYANGIEVLYLYEGEKLTYYEYWKRCWEGLTSFPENYIGIQPPYQEAGSGPANKNTFGYYFLYANPLSGISDDNLTYVYIRYPDGKEDEIKVLLYENKKGTVLLMGKIWINGELVYAMSDINAYYREMLPDSVDISDLEDTEDYYHPNYYPWLEPVLDDNGNPIGNALQPQYGTDAIVITK